MAYLTTRLIGVLIFLVAIAAPAAEAQDTTSQGSVSDLQVVDCLLPGQVRRLGQSRYITARRPIMTTAGDCRIRGGEYTEFDRADYRTALAVWLPAAEAGDPEAQTNAGEIFEKGLGTTPNYGAALIWYSKAAEQGYSRAQFNLGTLYERGLGVEADKLTALNWYRKAWDMPEDSVIYQTAAREAQDQQRAKLESEISKKSNQITLLRSQVDRLKVSIDALQQRPETTEPTPPAENDSAQSSEQVNDPTPAATASASLPTDDLRDQIAQLESMIAGLSEEKSEVETEYAAIPVFRQPEAVTAELASSNSSKGDPTESTSFGQYYALIIGNSDYRHMVDLTTPQLDVEKIGSILEGRYGFSVKVLLNASDVEVMHAINDLNSELDEDDNLLIYYAGHGSQMEMGDLQAGYWLPVNADPPPRDTHWISNESITRHLGRLKAKRVLVVADSCYAGLLSDAPDYLFLSQSGSNNYSAEFMKYKLSRSSRLMISSGGNSPVLDNGGTGHSVFASAFINILGANEKIMSGPQLFSQLKPIVLERSEAVGFRQEPDFKTIKISGNEAGDFFFVPALAGS
ncbi:caspase family protein [Luminiphilus sp. nBUS_16]|uniref:caspase family protein n=1 Tax=Luminiphilus sp. nBUS_16 TaxID=3395315 RepID=UPI003EBD3F9F